MLGLPHEICMVCCDFIDERDSRFAGFVMDHIVEVLCEAFEMVLRQKTVKTAGDERLFFVLQMDTVVTLDIFGDLTEFLIGNRNHRLKSSAGDSGGFIGVLHFQTQISPISSAVNSRSQSTISTIPL